VLNAVSAMIADCMNGDTSLACQTKTFDIIAVSIIYIIYIYVYLCMYIYRERERYIDGYR